MKWMSGTARRIHVDLLMLLLLVAVGAAALPCSALASLPPNDDFANAENLGNGLFASASGSNVWATAEPSEPGVISRPLASVWYRWTAPQSGLIRVDTCGSNFDTALGVFQGPTLGALGRVAANDDRCGSASIARFFAISGTTYSIAVDGSYGSRWGSIVLELRPLAPPSNDDFADAANLARRSTLSTWGTNIDATVEPREPAHVESGTVATVWYRWTAPASRRFRIDTCRSDFDTVIAVYRGRKLDALRWIAGNDDSRVAGCRYGPSRTRFKGVAGKTYRIAVAGVYQDEGSFILHLAKLRRR